LGACPTSNSLQQRHAFSFDFAAIFAKFWTISKEITNEKGIFAGGAIALGIRDGFRNRAEVDRRVGQLQRTTQLQDKLRQLVRERDDAQIVGDVCPKGRDTQQNVSGRSQLLLRHVLLDLRPVSERSGRRRLRPAHTARCNQTVVEVELGVITTDIHGNGSVTVVIAPSHRAAMNSNSLHAMVRGAISSAERVVMPTTPKRISSRPVQHSVMPPRLPYPDIGHDPSITIHDDKSGRFGTPWQKYTNYAPGEIPFARLSEIVYDSGLKLFRRETIEGSPTFLYENKFRSGCVSIRNTTDDIWIGANDHRLRKAQMLLTETDPTSTTAPHVTRYTVI
jgi:hypothetical protein